MQTVTSADGTEIAYERHGSGPPLVLVHGGSGTRRHWDAIGPHLEEEFTLLVPDRRGRGDSGDAEHYELEREVEDLRAVVAAADGEPTVFGHSFGGLVALAAAEELALDRLVLYEPAVLVGEHRDDDLADRMQARLDAGEGPDDGRREAMRLFHEEAGGVPDVERLPWWPEEANVDLVETVIRENRAVEAFELPAAPDVGAPTLLLTGEHSPEHLRDSVAALAERLTDPTVVAFDGEGHVATQTAPDRVATAVREFVERIA